MANKKRDINGYRKQLGRYKLNRQDILAIEKIIRIYADAREMKYANVSKLPDGRKHMPRKYADCHIKIGRYSPFHIRIGRNQCSIHYPGVDYIVDADSVKFLPGDIRRPRYARIECFPGISVTFRPFSTVIYSQTHYATGKELRIMKSVVVQIERYLSSCKKSKFNLLRLY